MTGLKVSEMAAWAQQASKGGVKIGNVYFNECVDFIVRMIEKYGDEIEFPKVNNEEKSPA